MVTIARLVMVMAVVTAVMTPVAPVSSVSSISSASSVSTVSMSMISLALTLNQGQVISLLRFILLQSLLVIQRQSSGEGSKQTDLNIEIRFSQY